MPGSPQPAMSLQAFPAVYFRYFICEEQCLLFQLLNLPTQPYLTRDVIGKNVERDFLIFWAANQIFTAHPLGLTQHSCAGPCHRCLFPEAPRPDACGRCSDAGVLGPVPGIIGTLQAMEAIKVVTGVGQTLSRRLLLLDALQGRMHTVKLRARVCVPRRCRACGVGSWVRDWGLRERPHRVV